ncbi:endonuclease G [Rhizomicrobium palustre]|uniref:Endonuclease n=1 Tax=Rhizomicrobium palustre TaxID=189966 RepID=A0A846MX31_9PROT|nr:DNA/RNA non-specific endonuclease [Rhizomicrobium palustre]NIK87701.1 endonuclease G [Rhizomicrobium palustre]
MRRLFFALIALGAAAAPALADEDFSKCEARYAAIGLPVLKSGGDPEPIAVCHQGYAVAFNPDSRVPYWVIERVPKAQLSGKAKRSNKFLPDPALGDASPVDADYRASGYDRGHQAPAGDFKSSQPMTNESFFFSNMAPQVGKDFNRGIWRILETDVRSWILCGDRPELYIITGPVFDEKEKWIPKGKQRVRVPDGFFKVIYDPTRKRALGMLLPNKALDTDTLPQYAVAIKTIEQRTGLVFFPALNKRSQTVLKSSKGILWGVDGSCQAGE